MLEERFWTICIVNKSRGNTSLPVEMNSPNFASWEGDGSRSKNIKVFYFAPNFCGDYSDQILDGHDQSFWQFDLTLTSNTDLQCFRPNFIKCLPLRWFVRSSIRRPSEFSFLVQPHPGLDLSFWVQILKYFNAVQFLEVIN